LVGFARFVVPDEPLVAPFDAPPVDVVALFAASRGPAPVADGASLDEAPFGVPASLAVPAPFVALLEVLGADVVVVSVGVEVDAWTPSSESPATGSALVLVLVVVVGAGVATLGVEAPDDRLA
jgi:hypothetical protein